MTDENLDLLDLDDEANDTLPEVAFASPRPRRPWLLLGIGLVVIALATYVIVRTVGNNSSSTLEIDLDAAPEMVVNGGDAPMPRPMPDVNPQPLPVPPAPMQAQMIQPRPEPVAQPRPVTVSQRPDMPSVRPVDDGQYADVRVVQDRREVVFNPNNVAPEPKPVVKKTAPVAKKPVSKPVQQKVANTPSGAWYVQFGSYSTRDAANAAGKKIRAAHSSLFSGKQFVVLASVLKDGRTTYRLRVAFNNSSDANGFCRNAKSDGLDCYVAK